MWDEEFEDGDDFINDKPDSSLIIDMDDVDELELKYWEDDE